MGLADKVMATLVSVAATVLIANTYGHLIADKINTIIATAFH